VTGAGERAAGPVAVLIGPPGSGKSTVGPLLAARLRTSFADTDDLVERELGKPVADIFLTDGEAAFRVAERAAVASALASHPGVLALGGGAVMDPQSRRLLAGHRVVYLETSFAVLASRVGLGSARPLLAGNPRSRLRALLAERVAVYQALAMVTVTTDGREPGEIAQEIAGVLAGPAAGGQADLGGHS
jgi:shikimate kinase